MSLGTRYCAEIDQTVKISSSENECRRQHGCEQKYCPLEQEFMPSAMDRLQIRYGLGSKI